MTSIDRWFEAHLIVDGHLLEYIAMLEGEPRPDEGLVEWHAWHES